MRSFLQCFTTGLISHNVEFLYTACNLYYHFYTTLYYRYLLSLVALTDSNNVTFPEREVSC